MHIKNLLANSSIQNIINQQNVTTATATTQNPTTSSISTGNTTTTTTTLNPNTNNNTNKIARKRKNNSINSTPNNIPNKLTTQQKENNNLTTISNNNIISNINSNILLTPNNDLINNNNNNSYEMKLLDKLKLVHNLQMSQPIPDNPFLSTNYPGKNHSSLLQRSNQIRGTFLNLELDKLEDPNNLIRTQIMDTNNSQQQINDKQFVDFILNEKNIQTKKLNNEKFLKQCYKMYSARIDRPPPLLEINNHILDSSSRLNQILNGDLNPLSQVKSPPNDATTTTADNNDNNQMMDTQCEDYLKKETNDFEYVQAKSPIINLTKNENNLIKKESIENEPITNNNNNKVTIKISKKASRNILDTMMKVSDLLQMTCPTSWILGKLISRETEQLNNNNNNKTTTNNNGIDQINNVTKANVSTASANAASTSSSTTTNPIINKETAYSIQHLMNASILKLCKFCESLLVDNNFIVNANLKEDEESQLNNLTSNEFGLVFCSEYCESLYEKSLILKNFHKKKQIENSTTNSTNNGSINNNNNSTSMNETNTIMNSSKLVMRWSHNLFKPKLNEEQTTNLSSSLSTSNNNIKLMETVKAINCNDKRICIFCNMIGDFDDNGPSRLLAMDIGKWCHLNCALWSNEVYETMNGSLVNVEIAYKRCVNIECCFCHHRGASLKCFTPKCNNYYHLPCAIKDKCAFNQDKVNFNFIIFYDIFIMN
jgi:hypothetical protein